MTRLPIRWIRARVYTHATEEEDRVIQALDSACPAGEDRRETTEGQYGNPILQMTRRLDNPKAVRTAWGRWEATGILTTLRSEVDARIDEEGILHFRIDKQRAYEGALALAGDADAIDVQVKLEAYPSRAEEIRRVAHALLAEVR